MTEFTERERSDTALMGVIEGVRPVAVIMREKRDGMKMGGIVP